MPQRPHQPDVFASAERATAQKRPRDRVLLVDGDVIAAVAPPDVVVYSLGWGSGLHQLDELEETVEERGVRAPAIVLTTPVWMRATRGITLRGPVRIAELLTAISRALSSHKR